MGRLESRLRRILEVTERVQKGAVHVLHLSGEDTPIQWSGQMELSLCFSKRAWKDKLKNYHISTRVVGSKVIMCVFSHLERRHPDRAPRGEDTQDVAEAQSGVQTYFLLTQTAHNEHRMWRCKWVSSFFKPQQRNNKK